MYNSPSRSASKVIGTYPPHLSSPRSIADEMQTNATTRQRPSTASSSTTSSPHYDANMSPFKAKHRHTDSSTSTGSRFATRTTCGSGGLSTSNSSRRLVFDAADEQAALDNNRDFVISVGSTRNRVASSRRSSRDFSRGTNRSGLEENNEDDGDAEEDDMHDDGDDRDASTPMLSSSSAMPSTRATHSTQALPFATMSKAGKRRLRTFYIALLATVIVMAVVSTHTATGTTEWSETIEKWKVQATTWTKGSGEPGLASGGNGSIITTDKGKQFVYINEFGGHWNSTPFSLDAQAQNYTPPLSAQWDYSTQRILGVNFGGWLNLEPFITPAVFEPYLGSKIPATDEWSLCHNLGWSKRRVIEKHYDTFITEQDFANTAAAGINWVRIPLPHWAVQTFDGEPFVSQVAWKYFLKAITWARKYGIRINLDLHTAPGSQNGWNHSGRYGSVGFLNGVMGVTNAQRTLNIIRALAEFISLPENSPVVPMMTVLNEPFMRTTGVHALRTFYLEAYRTIRQASGLGIGHGPMIVVHDGFKGTRMWHGWLEGADRLALESHRYLAFRPPNDDPLDLQTIKPCQNWGSDFNRTMSKVGLAITGEWSIATDDCGMFLNGVGVGTRLEGTYPTPELSQDAGVKPVGACDEWNDYTTWSDGRKNELQQLAKAHMDAFQNWFYWTWKTLPPLNSNIPANPRWSYYLGWQHGWIPKDPRLAQGFCASNAQRLGVLPPKQYRFRRPLHNYQIGLQWNEQLDPMGRPLGDINSTHLQAWGKFPPESVGTSPNRINTTTLPQYVKSSVPGQGEIRLKGPRPPDVVNQGQTNDKSSGWWVPVKGCKYLNPWEGVDAAVPEQACVEFEA
ncbi:hypothetical protein OIO90_002803 [Microbotryomycetes sp. JL221]|nr:hypothetical protein OIO90_002803 [Microbotryomycetes sp. JL221]